jgi:hypothetical protein
MNAESSPTRDISGHRDLHGEGADLDEVNPASPRGLAASPPYRGRPRWWLAKALGGGILVAAIVELRP